MEIDGKIRQANGRLKAGNLPVRIERSGHWLRIRATLPPKPSSDREESHQQRISLRLPATGAGLKRAEGEARKIAGEIATRSFDWGQYLKNPATATHTFREAIEAFKQYRALNVGSPSSWENDYQKIFNRLRLEKPFTRGEIDRVILEIPENTRTRQRAKMALGALCKFVGVDFDVSQYKATYKPSIRKIPTDEEIVRGRGLVPIQWRWVYSMMAIYGLRNHEIYHCNLDDFPILEVGEATKTGARRVFPLYPEWATEWEIEDEEPPPPGAAKNNSELGKKVSRNLSKYLNFQPYDLRHAWAIRSLKFGLPIELAAAQMGHSVAIHTTTYHRWISRTHYQQFYEMMLSRADRPKPPLE